MTGQPRRVDLYSGRRRGTALKNGLATLAAYVQQATSDGNQITYTHMGRPRRPTALLYGKYGAGARSAVRPNITIGSTNLSIKSPGDPSLQDRTWSNDFTGTGPRQAPVERR